MEKLPPEIFEGIFNYCTVKDILNVACCSRRYHSMVKPFLWRCVNIPVSFLFCNGPDLQNLKYTTSLRILDTYNGETLDEDSPDNEDLLRGALENGLLLAKLLCYCNPLKISSLHTSLCGKGLEYVSEILCHVKSLKLTCHDQINGEKLDKLVELEELILRGYHFTSGSLREIIKGDKLIRLKIHHCESLNQDSLVTIGQKVDLQRLLIRFSSVERKVDNTPLCSLTNLTHLTIKAAFSSNGLQQLCRSLTKLKSLNLSRSRFKSEGLAEIQCLTSLTRLSLKFCGGITDRCLDYLVNPLPLKSLCFSSDLFTPDLFNLTKLGISRLNTLRSLREVVVIDWTNLGNNATIVINSLCSREKWTLKFCISSKTYTFSR